MSYHQLIKNNTPEEIDEKYDCSIQFDATMKEKHIKTADKIKYVERNLYSCEFEDYVNAKPPIDDLRNLSINPCN